MAEQADNDASPFNFANSGDDSDSLSSQSLQPLKRPTAYRLCYGDDVLDETGSASSTSEELGPQPWGIAPVQFLYSIHTNLPSSTLSLRAKNTILSSISEAVVDSIYESDCPPQQRRRRRRDRSLSQASSASLQQNMSRRMEILSISQGDGHQWIGSCDENTDVDSETFCNTIEGVVLIGFDEMNYPGTKIGSGSAAYDFRSVGDVVLSRIQNDMANGNYLGQVNEEIRPLGVSIDQMNYTGSEYPALVDENAFAPLGSGSSSSTAATNVQQPQQITLFSKVAIPIMLILFILAMAFCWCAISSWPSDYYFFAKKTTTEDKRGSTFEDEDEEAPYEEGHMSTPKKSKMRGDRDVVSRERTPSLEATLQDLSKAEMLKYGNKTSPYSINSSGRRTYSTLPVNGNSNRFLPLVARSRSQPVIRVVDGSLHPNDTETSSISSFGAMVKNETNDGGRSGLVRTKGNIDDSISLNDSGGEVPTDQSPDRGIFSSFFGRARSEPTRNSTSVINLVDRVSSCTASKIENAHCFQDEEELPPSRHQDNNTVMRYVMPNEGEYNSLVEISPKSSRNERKPSSARMGVKKSAAYKAYISKKMLQREQDCEELSEPIPLEIGVKRTFTDEKGRIREMVAL